MSKKTRRDEQEKEEAAGISAFTAVLTAKLAETKSELLAEIKDTYARYEARLSTVQAAVDDHTERIAHLEQSADSTSIDVTEMKTTLSAIAAENAKLKAKLTDLEGRSRRNNIRIFGLPENIEGPTPTVFFSQLLFEVLGADVLSSPPELDRAHRSLAAKPGPAGKPRHAVICFHRFQTRELVVRTARRLRGNLSYKGSPIHIVEDYCPEVLEQRGQYRDVMRKLYQLGHKPALSRDVGEMYDGILHKPLFLPPGKSEAIRSLLVGLLQKDPHRRLGSIADFLEIKNHSFFTPINWDDLYHKRITPPYNPNVRGPADTQNIDPEFTREMVPNSVSQTPDLNASFSSSNAFHGFSFVATEDSFL